MDVRIYTWNSCPQKYKNLSPYTKSFFESGSKVTMVMVARKTNKTTLDQLTDHMSRGPTDLVSFGALGNRTHVLFWTLEK